MEIHLLKNKDENRNRLRKANESRTWTVNGHDTERACSSMCLLCWALAVCQAPNIPAWRTQSLCKGSAPALCLPHSVVTCSCRTLRVA